MLRDEVLGLGCVPHLGEGIGKIGVDLTSVDVSPLIKLLRLLQELNRRLPLVDLQTSFSSIQELDDQLFFVGKRVEELGSPHRVLDLVFAWLSPVFLRDVCLVKEEDAGRVVDPKRFFEVVIDGTSIHQAKLELASGADECTPESRLRLFRVLLIPKTIRK